MTAAAATDGGAIATAAMAGSGRCSGRSPITTSMTTRCGATATTTRSGITAMATSMPACSRPMAMTTSPAIGRKAAGVRKPAPAAGASSGSPDRCVRPTGANVRRRQPRHRRPADRPDPAGDSPNDAQRAALDDLANASVKAAQDIKAACPTQIALTAPARLAAMQQRIEAMISAVDTVQPPLAEVLRPAQR